MEARTRRRRRDRSVAEAERLVVAYETSGLSRQEFCERNDVTLTTLSRYVTRHRRQRSQTREPAARPEPQLVAVQVTGPVVSGGGELTVVLCTGLRIEVRRGFDANTLQALVRALEHC
jgi:hypothetical protein